MSYKKFYFLLFFVFSSLPFLASAQTASTTLSLEVTQPFLNSIHYTNNQLTISWQVSRSATSTTPITPTTSPSFDLKLWKGSSTNPVRFIASGITPVPSPEYIIFASSSVRIYADYYLSWTPGSLLSYGNDYRISVTLIPNAMFSIFPAGSRYSRFFTIIESPPESIDCTQYSSGKGLCLAALASYSRALENILYLLSNSFRR